MTEKTIMTAEIADAAHEHRLSRYRSHGAAIRYVSEDVDLAFAAGAAWQKERDNLMPASPEFDHVKAYQSVMAMLSQIHLSTAKSEVGINALSDGAAGDIHDGFNEIRDALGTLGEGLAFLTKRQGELQATALRGADRDIAILKHLQEIGDNVRGVSGAIGDRFGVVLDAVKDVGEKVEACMTIASNTEEGLSVSIEKLDKLGVEKWREAIKHVEAEGTTEPMHAEVKAGPVIIESNPEAPGDWVKSAFMRGKVKAADYDESGLGKLWADVTVNLEDVSDKVLKDLFLSDQIPTSRYMEEVKRREKPGDFERVDTDRIAIGEPFELADLRDQLRVAKELEAFWRKTAAGRGDRLRMLHEQIIEMGAMIDRLTGRETGA